MGKWYSGVIDVTAPVLDRRTPSLFAILLYALFLLIYYSLFDITFFHGINSLDSGDGHWQFLPYKILRERPLESLLYLHSRPPFSNSLLALGFQLGLGPRILILWNHVAAFLIIYYATRFCFFFTDNRRLGFPLAAIFLYGISLNLLAYLSDILYTLSTAALLSGFAWHGFAALWRTNRTKDREHSDEVARPGIDPDLIGAILFAGLLSLQRATYGLPVLAVVSVLFLLRRGAWDAVRFGLGASAPVLLWSFKNYLVFGFFAPTTLFGMTAYFNAGQNIFLEERRASPEWLAVTERIKRERPDLAPLLKGSMLKVSTYEQAGLEITRNETWARIPALMRHEKKSWWGASNKNTYEYIEISRKFSELSRLLIFYYPENYLLNVYYAAYQFMKPAWMYQQTVNPVWNTHPHLFKIYRLAHQDARAAREMRLNVSHGWDLFIYAYPTTVVLLALFVVLPGRRPREAYFLLLLFFAVATAGALLFTHAENMRYKFEIEPLARAIFIGWCGRALIRGIERFRRRGAGEP